MHIQVDRAASPSVSLGVRPEAGRQRWDGMDGCDATTGATLMDRLVRAHLLSNADTPVDNQSACPVPWVRGAGNWS